MRNARRRVRSGGGCDVLSVLPVAVGVAVTPLRLDSLVDLVGGLLRDRRVGLEDSRGHHRVDAHRLADLRLGGLLSAKPDRDQLLRLDLLSLLVEVLLVLRARQLAGHGALGRGAGRSGEFGLAGEVDVELGRGVLRGEAVRRRLLHNLPSEGSALGAQLRDGRGLRLAGKVRGRVAAGRLAREELRRLALHEQRRHRILAVRVRVLGAASVGNVDDRLVEEASVECLVAAHAPDALLDVGGLRELLRTRVLDLREEGGGHALGSAQRLDARGACVVRVARELALEVHVGARVVVHPPVHLRDRHGPPGKVADHLVGVGL
mmetsp:Transcript_39059/g.92400  ORF Transcript_39059/g.92400 Transcript_39059/m.92400 type:complete len:320 (-) Transcript_39059:55-1014(-)